jgi:hypothetical protein
VQETGIFFFQFQRFSFEIHFSIQHQEVLLWGGGIAKR